MRTYRLQIRLIQAASLLAAVVLISGFLGAPMWGTKAETAGGSKSTAAEMPAVPQEPAPNPKIVAIGDSFTYGYPSGPDKSWTKRLADNLQVTVVNKGKITQTSKDLLSRFDADVLAEQPGKVIIFGGTGDVLQGMSLADSQSYIQAMVEKARANHITPVLALPMPYPGVQDKVKELREWELKYAQNEKIITLDFASVLMNEQGKYLEGLSNNDKYPTAKGYEVMGDYATRVLK